MSTILTSPYTIPAALIRGEEVTGPGRWQPVNEKQRAWLPTLDLARPKALTLEEIKAILSGDAEVINQFFQENGSTIHLDPLAPNEFGVGIVLRWLVNWLHQGEVTELVGQNDQTYPAVFMNSKELTNHYAPGIVRERAIQIPTRDGRDRVFLFKPHRNPADEFELLELARRFLDEQIEMGGALTVFPMINAKVKGPLEWLLKMFKLTSNGHRFSIARGMRESLFQMDHVGASAVEYVAVVTTFESTGGPYEMVIDEPFVVVVQREGLELPLFVAFLDYDSWKRPER
jgi:hypothetical protein